MRARAGSPAPLRIGAAFAAVGLALTLAVPADAAGLHRPPPPPLATVVLAEIGFGYSVTSEGPLDASHFPAGSPSATAAAGALDELGKTIDTYQRSWQDTTGVNQVQDLLVRFSTTAGARGFVDATRSALAKGELVSTGPLASIPGAQRVTYFASTNQAGVGQTITMRLGVYAAVLSFFSGASGNPAVITPADAEKVAKAQYDAVVAAAGPRAAKARPGGLTAFDVSWAVLVVAVLGLAAATPLLLRRRRDAAHRVAGQTTS